MNLSLVLIIVLFISSFSYADEQSLGNDKIIFQLDEITVTEDEFKDAIETPNMTVIPPELLLQGIGSTVDSTLTRQAGIDVQRPQEVGAALDDESIKIRGFGARRILITIDGRTLNTPGTAGGYFIDWTTIPLNNIEKVEVIKGVSDPRFNNTLGGVINLVTRKPSSIPVFELQGLAASFDTYTTSFFHSWKPGKLEYSLSGGYSESNGYLRNGNYWFKNASVNIGYELPWNGKITGSLQYINVKKGFIVPNRKSKDYDDPDYEDPINNSYPASDGEIMYGGMGAYPEPNSWWKKEKYYINLGYEQTFSNSNLSLNYWWNHSDREAYNTRVSLGRVFHKKFYDDRSFGFDAEYKLFLKNHTVSFGGDFKRFKDDGDRNYSDDYREPFRNGNYVNSKVAGLFLMDDYNISDNFILSPGLRYAFYDGNAGPAGESEGIKDISMDGISPSLKATLNYNKNSLVYLSIARALRMPTPPEHYWHYSPDAGVNTSKLSFKKEDGIMIQGGWKTELPSKMRIEVSPYYYLIEDYIQFDLINFVSYNINKAKLYGIELEIAQQLGKGFSAFINYTYQKSKTEGDPFVDNFVFEGDRNFDEIPGLPEHKINLGFQYKGKNKEKVAIYAKYVSEQNVIYNNNTLYDTELKIRTQDSFITADIEASYPVTKNLEIAGYIHNIFDKNYQERFGFPAAERNFGLGIKAIF